MLCSTVWLLALCVHSSPVTLLYRIEEDCELGTVLADIKTDLQRSLLYNRTTVDQLRIVMLATQSAADLRRHFNVDEVTGLVRAATSLDRDDICPAADNCILNVDFAVQPAAYFQLIKVHNFCYWYSARPIQPNCYHSTIMCMCTSCVCCDVSSMYTCLL